MPVVNSNVFFFCILGAIAGIVVGFVVVVAFLILIFVCLKRKRLSCNRFAIVRIVPRGLDISLPFSGAIKSFLFSYILKILFCFDRLCLFR